MCSWAVRGLLLGAALGCAILPAHAQRAPTPVPTGLSPEVLSLACAPTLTFEPPPMPLRVTGSQGSFVRRALSPGDLVTINGGTDNGIEVGQVYYARRAVPREKAPIRRDNPAVIQTAGWLRVWAVDTTMSLATIEFACDAIELGDYLEPFALPTVPVADAARGPAERDNYARVVVGSNNRRNFGKGDYLVIDRGTEQGVTAGANFVIYRDLLTPGNFLFILGEAVAVDVRDGSSTLQVTMSRDGITVGDYVARRRQEP